MLRNTPTAVSAVTITWIILLVIFGLLLVSSQPQSSPYPGPDLAEERPTIIIREAHLFVINDEGPGGCNTRNDHLLLLEFRNDGDLEDKIDEISIPDASVVVSGKNSTVIFANTESTITFFCANTLRYTVGQTVSFTIRMDSGLTIPVAVTMRPQ